MNIQLRPRRQTSGKHRRSYREPDSDTDLESEPTSITKPRPTRSSRRIHTYREQTSSDDSQLFSSSASDSESAATAHSRVRTPVTSSKRGNVVRRSTRNKRKVIQTNSANTGNALKMFKRQKLNQPTRHKTLEEVATHEVETPLNMRAPPWQTLEYDILVRIMQYAAYPLYTSALRSHASIEWLCGVSRLCKSFHEATMATLLWEPPLLPVHRAHGLIKTLSQAQEHLFINYRTKVRSLNIEVKHTLVKKSGVEIADLLAVTPLLSKLRIYHWNDEMIGKAIWAEPVVAHFKWTYGGLFDHLESNTIRLKSFEWNGRFQDTLIAMGIAHQRPCMSNLTSVSIVNFNFTEKQEDDRLRARTTITEALSSSQMLRNLEFRNCTILDTIAMSALPLELKSLRMINCLSLTSDAIASYLVLGGRDLRLLYLEGNQVMDLAFMPRLAELCPHLEDLCIDLSYDDCSSYRDRNPLYDELLPNGSPTWPSSLTSIVVGPLRSLDIADAESFYASLINTASDLPYLRVLSIKTILNEASWRDRATLRAKWRPIFERVFAARKPCKPPVTKVKPESKVKRKGSQRKSVRLQDMEELGTSEGTDEGIVSIPGIVLPLQHQNRCEVLEFELSDQRPTQEQFREDDFLDSEPSDDGEWNGRDQTAPRSGYAW